MDRRPGASASVAAAHAGRIRPDFSPACEIHQAKRSRSSDAIRIGDKVRFHDARGLINDQMAKLVIPRENTGPTSCITRRTCGELWPRRPTQRTTIRKRSDGRCACGRYACRTLYVANTGERCCGRTRDRPRREQLNRATPQTAHNICFATLAFQWTERQPLVLLIRHAIPSLARQQSVQSRTGLRAKLRFDCW